MKITSLLTQYLYNNQRLDLPGIGSFTFDPHAVDTLESSKQRSTVLEGISFQSSPSLKSSPDLIAFISAQTGKMKALAAADLESHIQLAQEFLNIGKPFTFEGIGTLVRVKMNEYDFIPISMSNDKIKELQHKDTSKPTKEDSSSNYESFLSEPKVKLDWGKPVIAFLLLCGLGLAIWGGYAISKRASAGSNAAAVNPVQTVAVVDTVDTQADSLAKLKALANVNYKYVLEVAPGKRAFKRYNQLKSNLWDVHLETKDSVQYKLFLLLPTNTDTTRVLDSLTVMTGRRVYIESQN